MPHLPLFHHPHAEIEKSKFGNVSRYNPARAIGFMCVAGIFFGLSSVVLKQCSRTIPSMECAFFRAIVGFGVLLAVNLPRYGRAILGVRRSMLFLRALFGALACIAYVWAIPRMDLGLANGLNQTSPIFVCIFAAIFLGERFRWWLYLIVGVAFLGITLMIMPNVSGIHVNVASLWALGSAILSGLAYTCMRECQKTDTAQTIVFWMLGMSSIVAAIAATLEGWVIPGGFELAGLLATGLFAFIGQLCMAHAYHYAPATICAPFIYVSTVSSLILAFILWGENPGVMALAGCAIVIVCAILIGVLPKKAQ